MERPRKRGFFGRLEDRRWLAVRGPDAGRHLHAMLTRDLADLLPGEVRYAALVDDRAHYLADGWVLRPSSEWWIDVAAPVADRLRERLELFAVSADVTLEDSDGNYDLFHMEGGPAAALFSGFVPDPGTESGEGRCGSFSWEGVTVLWAERSLIGELGFSCLVPRRAAEAFDAALEVVAAPTGLARRTASAAERGRIEAGRPLGGLDVGPDHLLPEAGLWGAVSLDKGCFPGQEILQRIARQGRLQRRLVGLRLGAAALDSPSRSPAGAEVLDDSGAARGQISSWAPGVIPGEDSLALAWVRHPEERGSAPWIVSIGAQTLSCHLVDPPFVPLGRGVPADAISAAPAAVDRAPARPGTKS